MRKHFLFFLFLTITFPSLANVQKVWWVYFTDKNGSSFDPYAFFDPAAIERREKNRVSLYDISDYPVSPVYQQQVGALVDTLGYSSRWLNAVSVVATDEQINAVKTLPCVSEVVLQAGFEWTSASMDNPNAGSQYDPSVQIKRMQGEQFAANKITGKGINICILDAGFWGVDNHSAFSDLRFNNQIRKTRNFLRNDSIVYKEKTDHGTMVLSCIAGKYNGQPMGMAVDANFFLGIISKEYGNQYRAEERYIAGLEWADQVGAHIVNISGGPNENAYFAEDLDGNKPVISRACKVAASKGILVIAAAGNNGMGSNPQLLAPAETDSVLSVTAMGEKGFIADYSAMGPPPDFRRKPDICAPGNVIVAGHDKKGDLFEEGEGTSFSCPLVVGFAACLMQKYPEITAMGTIDSLRKSAHLYPYYDYAHGYGMPQAGYFFRDGFTPADPSFEFVRSATGITIHITGIADSLTADPETQLLFWNFTDSKGRVVQYNVIEVSTPDPVSLYFAMIERTEEYKLCVWYRGYYAETGF
ncbi:MAG TPA: S8 family serine peptidase [Bacteroidia bacterium]|nr:S8 family serine peptidase [Bacteroidia bacterium]